MVVEGLQPDKARLTEPEKSLLTTKQAVRIFANVCHLLVESRRVVIGCRVYHAGEPHQRFRGILGALRFIGRVGKISPLPIRSAWRDRLKLVELKRRQADVHEHSLEGL